MTSPSSGLAKGRSVEAVFHLSSVSVALSRRRVRRFPRTQSTVSSLLLVMQSTVYSHSSSLELQLVLTVDCVITTADYFPLTRLQSTVLFTVGYFFPHPVLAIVPGTFAVDCFLYTVDYFSSRAFLLTLNIFLFHPVDCPLDIVDCF